MKRLFLGTLVLALGIRGVAGDSITFAETYREHLERDSAGDVIGRYSRSFSATLTFPEAGCVHLQADTRVGFTLDGDGYEMALGSADNQPNREYNLVLRDESEVPFGRMTIRRTFSTLFITGQFAQPGESILTIPLEGEAGPVGGEVVARVWLGDFSVERLVTFRGRQSIRQGRVGEETVDLRTVTLQGAADYRRHIVSVLSHRPNERLFTNSIELRGKVTDHAGEVLVHASHNGVDLPEFGPDESGAWVLPLELAPGTNAISLWAINRLGNVSATNRLRLSFVVPAPLTLTWDEGGAVLGLTNGQWLEVGRDYRLTARPDAGQRFAGWNAGAGETTLHSPEDVLTFRMQPGLALHASFIPPVFQPLSLTVTPGNEVLGVTNGQLLEIGRAYQALARANSNGLFLSWSGSHASSNPALRFIMESNTVLQANFAPNPWPPIAGHYGGILVEGRPDSREPPLNSGTFVLTLTANGRYSGKLRLRDQPEASFSGQAGLDGGANVVVSRPGCRDPMQLLLWFDVENASDGRLLGEWSTTWATGFLVAQRPAGGTNAGRYTFRISRINGEESGPTGDGAGSLNIGTNGQAVMVGTMGDGTPFTASPVVSGSSALLHVPLYGNRGFLQGIFVANATGIHDDSIFLGTSEFSWFKPPASTHRFYPEGFLMHTTVEAVRYTPPPAGASALPWTNGVVALWGGNLPDYYESPISLLTNVVTLTNNSLRMSVNLAPRTGLLTLGFTHPATGKIASGKGALLQYDPLDGRTDFPPIGAGWFRGMNESGYVRLLPVLPEAGP